MVPSQVRSSSRSLNSLWVPCCNFCAPSVVRSSCQVSCSLSFGGLDSVDDIYYLSLLSYPLYSFTVSLGYSQHISFYWALCDLQVTYDVRFQCTGSTWLVVHIGRMFSSLDRVAFLIWIWLSFHKYCMLNSSVDF